MTCSSLRDIFSLPRRLLLALAAFAALGAMPARATISWMIEFQPVYTMYTTDTQIAITARLRNTGTDPIVLNFVSQYNGLGIQNNGGTTINGTDGWGRLLTGGQFFDFTFATVIFPNAPVGIYDVFYSSPEASYWPSMGVLHPGGSEIRFLKDNLPKLAVVAPPVVMPVPESGTWAMMILGLGLAGAMLRRRRGREGSHRRVAALA